MEKWFEDKAKEGGGAFYVGKVVNYFEEEGWWPLKCKGKDAGKVQVTIQWLADPPKPTRRSVCIAIKAARGLRKADIVVRMQSFSSI